MYDGRPARQGESQPRRHGDTEKTPISWNGHKEAQKAQKPRRRVVPTGFSRFLGRRRRRRDPHHQASPPALAAHQKFQYSTQDAKRAKCKTGVLARQGQKTNHVDTETPRTGAARSRAVQRRRRAVPKHHILDWTNPRNGNSLAPLRLRAGIGNPLRDSVVTCPDLRRVRRATGIS